MAVYITEGFLDKIKDKYKEHKKKVNQAHDAEALKNIQYAKQQWDTGECTKYEGDNIYTYCDLGLSENDVLKHFENIQSNIKTTLKSILNTYEKYTIRQITSGVNLIDKIVVFYESKNLAYIVYDFKNKKLLNIVALGDSDSYSITKLNGSLYNNEYIDAYKWGPNTEIQRIAKENNIEFKV